MKKPLYKAFHEYWQSRGFNELKSAQYGLTKPYQTLFSSNIDALICFENENNE